MIPPPCGRPVWITGDCSVLLLCAATGRELAAALGKLAPEGLAEARDERPPRPFAVRLRQGPALACTTGVGPINAAMTLGVVLASASAARTPVTAALNLGLAGAFDLDDMPLRTHCAVVKEIWPEYGLHDGRSVVAAAFGFPQWDRPAAEGGPVRDCISLADPDMPPPVEMPQGWKAGPLPDAPRVSAVTVAGVSASAARARQLRDTYPGVAVESMEGFAVAYVCARYGIPCWQWRTVSNKAGPRAAHEKDFPGALRALGELLPAFNLL